METDAHAAHARRWSRWMDAFFEAYYARRPVHATFIGVHDHDHRLPDVIEAGRGDTVAGMRALLDEAGDLDGEGLDPVRALDLRLARGVLEIELAEHASEHAHRGNPSLHTGDALFGVMSLFLPGSAPAEGAVEAATERMEAVPAFLAAARDAVRRAPAPWIERAIRECDAAVAFLTGGVALLAEERSVRDPAFRRAADRAAAAFAEHGRLLGEGLRGGADRPCSAGEEMLALCMTRGHFLEDDADEVEGRAADRLAEAEAALEAGAADFGAATPEEALAGLAERHPSVDAYYGRYREIADEVRARVDAAGVLTWPDEPIRWVPRPDWTRSAAPGLYFLFYRSPAAFGRPPVHDHLVTPVDRSLPADEVERLLRANNDAVIRTNHVVHHGGVGHHVQNGHAFRSRSRIGRVAAVDCASRIAMLCGGTMAEGWACYATELVDELGGLTPLEAYGELRSRTRMCARALVDVRLHRGRISFDEAVALYRQRAGMSEAAARAEAVKTGMFPGTALMYLTGTDLVHRTRRDVARARGADFDLRRFHDAFLSWGSVPVALVREALLAGTLETTPGRAV